MKISDLADFDKPMGVADATQVWRDFQYSYLANVDELAQQLLDKNLLEKWEEVKNKLLEVI